MTSNTETETYLYEDAEFIGLHPDALGVDPFFTKQIEIAVGANRQERNWQTKPMTRGDLVASLIKFERGAKDGLCITQGPLINGQRIAKNVIANHIIMLDCDTGESLDSLEAKVHDAGVFAVLWTTYSHMKSVTEIPEDRLVKLARDKRSNIPTDNVALCALAADYLAAKRVDTSITNSIHLVTKEHREGGMKYVVHHDPMPRARVLMFLQEPYVFAIAKATQAQAIQDWKEAYAGVAEMLGVDYDQSCVDPSRLMYTPRIAANIVDPYEAGHDIRVIAGKALDLDKVERVGKSQHSRNVGDNPLTAAASGVGVTDNRKAYPQWLLTFLKKYGDEFDIIGFCEAYDHLLSNNGEKAELTCPNEDRHTEQKADDRAFCVMNGENGFWAGCQHATCKEDSGGDRAWWLQKLCEKYGVGYDDLLTFCPTAENEQAEQIEHDAETADAAESAFADLKIVGGFATAETVTAAVERISHVQDAASRTELIRRLRAESSWGVGQLNEVLRDQLALRDAEREAERQVVVEMTPVPDNPEDAAIIWLHWEQPDQCRCAVARLLKMNRENPEFFRRTDGTVVTVVNNTRSGARIHTFESLNDVILHALYSFGVRFVGIDDEGREVSKNCPEYIIKFIKGTFHKLEFPELEKISKVPVFSEDGTLITEKGYNPLTRAYYDPGNYEYLAVPEVVTNEDLDSAVWSLLDVVRDFPFSDAINDVDPEPIRLTNEDGTWADTDADGFPWPNWDRGRGSRANALAMILQPFARAMIDGPCPNYHVDKPAIGTGAGFLVDAAWIINEGGDRAEVKTLSHDNAEIKKAMTAALLEAKAILFLDNIQHQVDSPDLAAALTAGTWSDRILGQSSTVNIPIRTTFIMAGNRIKFNRDMMRRNVPIYMNAATPNPASDRTEAFYKHPKLHQWMVVNRPQLVWACHVIIKAWVQAGRPRGSVQAFQSFNDYSDVMGGILDYAGISGFLSNREKYMEMRAEEQNSMDGLTKRIWDKFGEDRKTASELLEACAPDGASGLGAFGASDKRAVIDPSLDLNLPGNTDAGLAVSLGKYIRRELLGGTYIVDEHNTKVSWVTTKQNGTSRYGLKKIRETHTRPREPSETPTSGRGE